jgi:hypothetical protein
MTPQHTLLNQCIHNLIRTSSKELLPIHRHLLQQDFAQLGNAETLQRQIWVASMESALGAASHFSTGHFTLGSLHRFFSSQACPWSSQSSTILSRQSIQPCPQNPCQLQQQTLPASFWVSQSTHPSSVPPPHMHTTDLTRTRYCLHWKKVDIYQSVSGQA